jgi:hypothetical protein
MGLSAPACSVAWAMLRPIPEEAKGAAVNAHISTPK